MSTLRISDAPLLPDVDGTEKIPTGGRGDYAISVDQIKNHIFQDVGKELVGLGNVDNTSDLDKPVSAAQQAALNLKADKTYVDTTLELKADKTNVYTRSETSLALSQKADLINGVVPENQIPSSFNDVLEFTTPNLPIIGESGKIYVTTDNNKTWRWGGNKYVEISGWNPDSVSKAATLPTYYTKEAGVDPITGVTAGAYFNVRSSSDDSYIDEYQNVGGVATPTGKSYPSSSALNNIPHNNLKNRDADGAHPASAILDTSGLNQQQINDSLIRIVSNKNDLLDISNARNNQVVYVVENKKRYIYNSGLLASENGVTIIGKWEMEVQEAYYASWFCPQSSIDNVNEPQTEVINSAYRYATEKGRAFIIDQPYYVESIGRKGTQAYPSLGGNDLLDYAVRVLSNSKLIFVKGVGKLKLVPNTKTHSRVLCVFDVENYEILDPECIGDKDSHLGTTGEQHYMIAFHASRNGYVRSPVCRNSWGDGFYFGYPEYVSVFNVDVDYPTDLVIDGAYLENSSRNGISLCGAENLTINNPVIDIVDRIAPMAGIDIEPEEDFVYSGKRMHLKNVKIHNLTVKNALNYGVMSFIFGNREVDVSFTGTTTFSAKAPHYCSLPIWHLSARGSDLTEEQYTASGSINFEKVVMTDAQAQWHITAPITFHSELGKIKLNIGDLTHTKYQAGAVAFAFDNSSNIIASWSGGLSVGKITLNAVGAVELGQSGVSVVKNLRDINLPIPEKHEVTFLGRGLQFGDGVNIGGHALVGGSNLNENQLINNIVLVPEANPDDGNAIYSQVYVVNKNRKLSYSLVAGLTPAAIGQGIRIANAGAFKVCATKEASITFEISDYPGLKIHGSYGVWTNP